MYLKNNKLTVSLLFALGGVMTLTMMDALAKHLVSGELALVQILTLRSLFIVLILGLVMGARGKLRTLAPVHWRGQIIRGSVGLFAPLCFFSALIWLPLTNATVVSYTAIFATTALSAWLLKERVGPWRWSAIVAGYIGVAIALQPTGEGSVIGYALVLLASLSYALMAILGKRLSGTESSASLVMFYNLMLGVGCALFLPWMWQAMTPGMLAGICLFALMAVTGQWLITEAYARLDGSVVAPLEYTSLLWAVLLDIVVFHITPTSRVITGAIVIISASLIVILREHRQRIQRSEVVP